MKKLGLIGIISFLCFHYSAQCDPDPIYADSVFGIWPSPQENLISGEVNIEYSQVINFKIPDEKIDSDLISDDIPLDSVLIESIQLNNISNLPPGLFYSCNIGNCTWEPGSGCTEIFGVPTQAGLFQLSIELIISTIIEIPFIGLQSIDYPFTYTYSLNVESCNQVTNLSDFFCDSYTFNGEEINSPGVYLDTLIASNGCDSVVNLNLYYGTIEAVDNITICGNYTWLDGLNYSSDINGPTYTVSTNNSCDTTYTLDLTILETDFSLAFLSSSISGQVPFDAEFINQTPNLNNYHFFWNFGDGTVLQDNGEVVNHTFSYSGVWDVSLIAEDINSGCLDTLTYQEYITTSGSVECNHEAVISALNFSACQGDSVLLICDSVTEFTYQWLMNGFPINGANSFFYYALESGNYSVIISSDECDVFSSYVELQISTMSSLEISSSSNNLPCQGGTVTLYADSNYYNYNWSSGSNYSNEIIDSIGWYYLVVEDSLGCQQQDSIFIASSNPPEINLSSQNLSCFGSGDGAATVTPFGGVSPYTYNWDNGDSSSTINNLSAGFYIVYVTDSNDCVGFGEIEVTQPIALEIDLTINYETCLNAMDGSIDVTTAGGVPPYNFLWTNGNFFVYSEDIGGLSSGTYFFGIEDNNGCTLDTVILVQELDGPQTGDILGASEVLPLSIHQYSVSENTTSSFFWNITNGNIISGQGENTVSIQWGNFGVGQLNVIETNASGCVGNAVNLDVIIGTVGINQKESSVRVYPNPAMETINIFINNYNGIVISELRDIYGNIVHVSKGNKVKMINCSAGIYFLRVSYGLETINFKILKN